MGKNPAFQFYPGDWLRDNVSGCSLAAQGLWLRMMIIMHDSDHYGYLSVKGRPMPEWLVAKKCGCPQEVYQELLQELLDAGVPRFNKEQIIFSKRMVEDEKRRNTKRLRKQKERENSIVAPLSHKCRPTSSTSSSVSSSTSKKDSLAKEDFKSLLPGFLERYSDHDLVLRCLAALKSTRRSGDIADSLLIAIFRNFERYPAEQVEGGMTTYLDRDCAGDGKREQYLMGIIRHQQEPLIPKQMHKSPEVDKELTEYIRNGGVEYYPGEFRAHLRAGLDPHSHSIPEGQHRPASNICPEKGAKCPTNP